MARTHKRPGTKKRPYRKCVRCRSLIPHGYGRCTSCGHSQSADWVQTFIEKAMRVFPGSREL